MFIDVSLENPMGVVVISKDLPEITVVAVPEPSTWALLLAGFVGLGLVYRRARALPAA